MTRTRTSPHPSRCDVDPPITPKEIAQPKWSATGRTAFITRHNGSEVMFQKIATVVLIGAALGVAACNTVRGAARDVNSVANCTENAINGSTRC